MVLCEYKKSALVSRETIWKFWTDVAHWHEWDPDIERAKLDGDFRLGQTGTLKPKNGSVVSFKTVECTPFKSFSDESTLFLATLRFDHLMQDTAHGLEIMVRVSISGPLAFFFKWLMAKDLCKGFKEQMVTLIEAAQAYEGK